MRTVLVTFTVEDDFTGTDDELCRMVETYLEDIDSDWWDYNIRSFKVEIKS